MGGQSNARVKPWQAMELGGQSIRRLKGDDGPWAAIRVT